VTAGLQEGTPSNCVASFLASLLNLASHRFFLFTIVLCFTRSFCSLPFLGSLECCASTALEVWLARALTSWLKVFSPFFCRCYVPSLSRIDVGRFFFLDKWQCFRRPKRGPPCPNLSIFSRAGDFLACFNAPLLCFHSPRSCLSQPSIIFYSLAFFFAVFFLNFLAKN